MMADGKNDTALGLGERLRSARKARALTLEQAAFTLRLEAPVLRALEDERYDQLGASVFVRGHLRAYAKLLGLSEDAVLAAYRAADPNADAPPKVTRELEKPLTTTPGPLAIAAAIILALLAMLLMYVFSSGPEPQGPAQPLQNLEPEVPQEVPPPPPLDANPVPEPLAGTTTTDAAAPAPVPETAAAAPAVAVPASPGPEATAAPVAAPEAAPATATPATGTFE